MHTYTHIHTHIHKMLSIYCVRGSLQSLGRGLLHGDVSCTGDRVRTVWQVRLADFIALQSAYLRLYTQSFGAKYTQQLTQYIPQAFPPSFEVPLTIQVDRSIPLDHSIWRLCNSHCCFDVGVILGAFQAAVAAPRTVSGTCVYIP